MTYLDTTPPPCLTDPDWPAACRHTPPGYAALDYLDWHTMADARAERGEGQRYCLTCQRYRWETTPCAEPATEEEEEPC